MDEPTNDAAAMVPAPAPGAALAAAAARTQTMALAFSGLIPQSIGEAMTLCTALAKSTAIPKALRQKPESILTVVMAGLEIGLTPIRAIQSITNISGNLAMKADLQLALVRRSGLLEYFDEGFELAGETDTDLAARTKDGQKILALVKTVPAGKPYGWTTAKRKGDNQLTTRTFTWLDAERAFVYDQDEDDPGSTQKIRKKLSEKFNYQAWPQSMYPRRSRGQVLQTGFSDVLAGMPSVESLEGGQIIDVAPGDYSVGGPDAADLLADMRNQDAEATTGIELAFQNLDLAPGRQLQLLTKFKGDPKALYLHLRDEYTRRQGKGEAPPPKKAAAPKAADQAPAQPAAPAPAPEPAKPAAQDDPLFSVGFEAPDGKTTPPAQQQPAADQAPATKQPDAPQPAADQKTKPTVSELAARFKTGLPTF